MIRGKHRGIGYTIEMIQHPILGTHYDVTLTIGTRLRHEQEPSLSRVVQSICHYVNTLPPEEAEVIFHSHHTEQLITRWNDNNRLIQQDAAITAPKAPILIAEMLHIFMELKGLGYSTDENGCWFHLSNVN